MEENDRGGAGKEGDARGREFLALCGHGCRAVMGKYTSINGKFKRKRELFLAFVALLIK
jgi:hypothetical protein